MTEQDPQRTLTEDERAELESLRAQVAELREEVSRVDSDGARPRPTKPARRRTWPRTTTSGSCPAAAAWPAVASRQVPTCTCLPAPSTVSARSARTAA